MVGNLTGTEGSTTVTSLLLTVLVGNDTTSIQTDSINSSTTVPPSSTESTVVSTTSLPYPTTCINGTSYKLGIEPTDFSAIPTKEIIIVILMLLLWVYSIMQTRKA